MPLPYMCLPLFLQMTMSMPLPYTSTTTYTVNEYPVFHFPTRVRHYSYQRYLQIRDYPRSLLFSVAQGIFWLSSERLSRSRYTLNLIEGGEEGSLHSVVLQPCSPAMDLHGPVDPSVRIVAKVEPLLILSISLIAIYTYSTWVFHFPTWVRHHRYPYMNFAACM